MDNTLLGYNQNLFVLPFDHRSSFVKLFGFADANLNPQEQKIVAEAKEIIYDAFKKAVSETIPKEQAAILIDEEYGDEIITDAKSKNYNVILTTEKSGQEEFAFEYGSEFGEHIEKYKPTFVKALIRYKSNANWDNLKTLSDYCHQNGYKFLLEVLSEINTPNAQNMVPIISALQELGIEPDVWKLEGMEKSIDYQQVIEKIQEGQRTSVGLVILGRGENREKVEQWIRMGRDVRGVIGFAIGRTIFLNPIMDYNNHKITKEEAITQISANFQYFYRLFIKAI